MTDDSVEQQIVERLRTQVNLVAGDMMANGISQSTIEQALSEFGFSESPVSFGDLEPSAQALSDLSPTCVAHRIALAMINEGANLMAEGLVQSSAQIDAVVGLGRGVMDYADQQTPRAILRDLRALQDENPDLWVPSQMIEAMVAMGTRFSDFFAPDA